MRLGDCVEADPSIVTISREGTKEKGRREAVRSVIASAARQSSFLFGWIASSPGLRRGPRNDDYEWTEAISCSPVEAGNAVECGGWNALTVTEFPSLDVARAWKICVTRRHEGTKGLGAKAPGSSLYFATSRLRGLRVNPSFACFVPSCLRVKESAPPPGPRPSGPIKAYFDG